MRYQARETSPTQSPLRTGFADVKTVTFPTAPVTQISRPLNHSEAWALYDFEKHACECESCYKPYEVHRSGGRLCRQGHSLAQEVAKYVYSKADGAQTYSTTDKLLRVEIPSNHPNVLSLLRAMERSLRHTRQRPIVTHEIRYPVVERKPATVSKPTVTVHHREPATPSSPPKYEVRQPALTVVESASRRQSIYPTYNVQIREPGNRHATRPGFTV